MDNKNTLKRILIKISGEAISKSNESKFDLDFVSELCNNIKNVIDLGVGVSIVIGGGNIIRGRDFKSSSSLVAQEAADSMGMLATVINGILFKNTLNKIGIKSQLVSSLKLPFGIIEKDFSEVSNLIDEKKIVIFVGGVGLPYFSTDTASVIGAFISKSCAIFKATKTDGIYEKDPNIYNDSKHISTLSYKEAIEKNIGIMDKSALALAMEKNIPIYVFSVNEKNCFVKVINDNIKHSVIR